MAWHNETMKTVAALFVETGGCYFGLDGVDPWDEGRDARLYAGPHSVVAHPPCARWSRLANVHKARYGTPIGEDGGCFEAALASVRAYGGVLEHPAQSMAFKAFGIPKPLRTGWMCVGNSEYVCQVAQSAYGHQAQKLTWLLFHGNGREMPPELDWNQPRGTHTIAGDGKYPRLPGMRKKDRIKTPPAFRDVLLQLARMSNV
jgi:hypothetical protein